MYRSRILAVFVAAACLGGVAGCGSEADGVTIGGDQSAVRSWYSLTVGDTIEPFQMRSLDTGDCLIYDSTVAGNLTQGDCTDSNPENKELWSAEVVSVDPVSPSGYEYTYKISNMENGDCLHQVFSVGPPPTAEYEVTACSDDTDFYFNAHDTLWFGWTQLTTDGFCMVSNAAGGHGGPPAYYAGELFSATPPATPPCVVGTPGDAKEWFSTRIVESGCSWAYAGCHPLF